MFKAIRDERVDPMTEVMLMWAARRQHIVNLIEPALKRGEIVICDRFIASTFAYQIYGRGMDKTTCFDPFLDLVMNGLWPDKTIILDVSPEVGSARALARGALDRLEGERLDFFERVRGGYKAYANLDRQCVVIDSSGTMAEVFASVREQVRSILPALERAAPAMA